MSDRCPGGRKECEGADIIERLEDALAEQSKEIEKLRRACAVLYWGSPELHHVAENAYSGCASTQRDDPYELRKVLEARRE